MSFATITGTIVRCDDLEQAHEGLLGTLSLRCLLAGRQATRNSSNPVLPDHYSSSYGYLRTEAHRIRREADPKSAAAHASTYDGIGGRHTADDVVVNQDVSRIGTPPIVSEDIVLHVVRELDMLLMTLARYSSSVIW